MLLVYGSGCLVEEVRGLYDIKCYFDVTPKEAILRIRRGQFANLGDKVAAPANRVIRRCYYADFEMGVRHRGKLLRGKLLDYYMASDRPDHIHMIPMEALSDIFRSLACYPFRCKPVYLEGVWGGTYVKKLRNLPDTMRNCAWVFDLIPMEVSIVVEAGDEKIDFPYFSFVQKEGEAIMGRPCVEKFGGYFPIRFNYDDTFHSNGNMSIQVHSGAKYNQEHFGELGRQDESYYVVVAGQDAKTFVGFRDDADTEQFIRDIKLADTEYKPVDYLKYVSYEDSKPGLQVMLPAGTIHSSGRNQVVLEIGSLSIGSYTYKLYDYLRADLDGKPRPIHTWHGERTLAYERTTSWVRNNIVQQPRTVREGDGWAEKIVGEHDLLYFTLRRLEFEKRIEDDTCGKFHVLTLVDGERIRIRSVAQPERYFDAEYNGYGRGSRGHGPLRDREPPHGTHLRPQNDAERWVRQGIAAACCSMSGERSSNRLWRTPPGSSRSGVSVVRFVRRVPREEIEGSLAAAVARGAAFAAERGMELAGIGIAIPGPFDYAAGVSRMTHKFRSICGVDLRGVLARDARRSRRCGNPFHAGRERRAGRGDRPGQRRRIRRLGARVARHGAGLRPDRDGRGVVQPGGRSRRSSSSTFPTATAFWRTIRFKQEFLRHLRRASGPYGPGADGGRSGPHGRRGGCPGPRDLRNGRGHPCRGAPRPARRTRRRMLLLGGQISRSFAHMEAALRDGLRDVAGLTRIAPAEHIGEAAFYGLLAQADGSC